MQYSAGAKLLWEWIGHGFAQIENVKRQSLPYEELSDEEKVYDRNTSIETLKMILKLGFEII